MQQITNQKFESLREQLATSYKQSQIFTSHRNQNYLFKSSLMQSQESCLEQSIPEQVTIQSSFKSQKKKKYLARVTYTEYDQMGLGYSNLGTLTKIVIMIQRNYRRHVCVRQFEKKIRCLRNRKFVVAELYQIEKNYNADLEVIVNVLMKEIRQGKLLSEEEVLGLFLNVEQILSLNQRFYSTIEQIVQGYHHFLIISEQFKIFVPFFKIYYDYCSRFQLHEVQLLRKNKLGFNQYIENVESTNILKGLTFESFLVKPVQQLPRYVLLIEKLLKYTESSHPDYAGLKVIQEQFCKINSQINQMMSTTQSNLKLLAQFGTIDQQEIELIQKKQLEEEQYFKQFQDQVKIDVVSYFKQKEGFSKFIVYIIQIQIYAYRIRTYQRFSDLLELQYKLRDKQIEFDHLNQSCMSATSESNLIRQRQLRIKDFLKSLFLNKNMKTYQTELITHLDLPENIFEQHHSDLQTTMTMRGSYTTLMRNTLAREDEIEVVVNLPDGKSVTLQILQCCKCLDLIETVCRSIFLEPNFDFKLMIAQNNKHRYLDDNEVVFKVMNNYNIRTSNFITRSFNSIYLSLSNKQKPIFYLRKYLYLCQEIEQKHYCENKMRSALLYYQELNQLKDQNLTQSEYVLLCSLAISINYNQTVHKITQWNHVRTYWFQDLIPSQIFRSISVQEWKKQIFATIRSLLQQCELIIQQIGQKDEIRILEIEFLNCLGKLNHGVKTFQVIVVKSSIKLPNHVILGIKHNTISIFNVQRKLLLEIAIQQVMDIKLNNERLLLKLQEGEMQLQYSRMFEIYRLLEEYQQINIVKMKLGVGDALETNDASVIA